MTLYDVTEVSEVDGPQYQALRENPTEKDQENLPNLQFISRGVYENISTVLGEGLTNDNIVLPEKYFILYSDALVNEGEPEIEFNKWYDEEHMGIISKIPGYIRGRRFKLASYSGMGEAEGKTPGQYVSIFEFGQDGFFEDEQFKIAGSTPWTAKIVEKAVISLDLRGFVLDRAFKKPL